MGSTGHAANSGHGGVTCRGGGVVWHGVWIWGMGCGVVWSKLRVVKAGYRNLQIGSWQLYGMYNVACLHVQFTSYACICMYNIIYLASCY